MSNEHPRMSRELRTIEAMINIYCRDQHSTKGQLCSECQDLLTYAGGRLDKCPFQADKPTCANCTVHCYKPALREQVRAVMRYAGPRMVLRHPILTLFHFIDGRREAPPRPGRQPSPGASEKQSGSKG